MLVTSFASIIIIDNKDINCKFHGRYMYSTIFVYQRDVILDKNLGGFINNRFHPFFSPYPVATIVGFTTRIEFRGIGGGRS